MPYFVYTQIFCHHQKREIIVSKINFDDYKIFEKSTNNFFICGRSLNVYFRMFKIFELIKMVGVSQNSNFIKLELKTIFFGSLKNIREEFEIFGGNLESFRS